MAVSSEAPGDSWDTEDQLNVTLSKQADRAFCLEGMESRAWARQGAEALQKPQAALFRQPQLHPGHSFSPRGNYGLCHMQEFTEQPKSPGTVS